MARKRKSGNENRGQGRSTITRTGRPANPFARKCSRYSGKYLMLVTMGGTALFILKKCVNDGNNDGDSTFHSVVSECINDDNSATVCAGGWNNAEAEFYSSLPRRMSKQSYQTWLGDCYLDGIDQSWVPIFSGFLFSCITRKNRDEQHVYSSGGSSYASCPVWRTTSGGYSWCSGSEKHNIAASHSYTTKKASTVLRGGYRRSSSAHGHWGS